MTVGGGAAGAPQAIDPKKIRLYGLVGSVLGIYIAYLLNAATGTNVFSLVGVMITATNIR